MNHKPKIKRVFSNYRITIEVDEPWTSEKDPQKLHEYWLSAMNSVINDIKRHVDGCVRIDPDWNSEEVCIYCESDPESDPETGQPMCCNKAVADYDTAHEKAGG